MTRRAFPIAGKPRVSRSFALVVLALAATACLRQDLDAGVILRETPRPTAASPITPGVYTVGQTGVTANGNAVTVYAFEAGLPSGRAGVTLGAADIEACTSRTSQATVDPRSFELELADLTHRPNAQDGPKEPLLERQTLSPGRCARGWVHFEYRANETPAAIVLQTRPEPVRWKIS